MIKQRQRRSVERVQSFLPLYREPFFLWLVRHFIALSHLKHTKQPIISGFRLCGVCVCVGGLQRELFMCVSSDCAQKSDSGEIKRKSKAVSVRTGCFQHRIPQHQLAGCAATGSYWSSDWGWSGPAGGSKHTSSPGLYEIRWRATLCLHLSYRSSPVPGLWRALAAISYLRIQFPEFGSRTVDGSPGHIGKVSVALTCFKGNCFFGSLQPADEWGSGYSSLTAN